VLYEEAPGPVWYDQYDFLEWKGAKELRALPSYGVIEEVVNTNEELFRRMYAAHDVIYSAFPLLAEKGTPYLFLQNVILRRLIEEQRSFEFDLDKLIGIYKLAEAKLSHPEIINASYVPLRKTILDGPLGLSADITIRELFDEEISDAMSLGVLTSRRLGQRRDFLSYDNQYAICRIGRTQVTSAMIASSEFFELIERAISPKALDEIAMKVVCGLNLYCDHSVAQSGEPWNLLKLSLNTMTSRSGGTYAPPFQNYSSAILNEKDYEEFASLVKVLLRRETWKQLGVSLTRFSDAACRPLAEDAILDLAIAAESLFGGRVQGEATYKVSLHAALLLGDETWPKSEVRKFFKEVYSVRSSIVHGSQHLGARSREPRSQKERFRERLSDVMRAALIKAITELERNGNTALDWNKRLDTLLDEPDNP
jgi:hypothetical protein